LFPVDGSSSIAARAAGRTTECLMHRSPTSA